VTTVLAICSRFAFLDAKLNHSLSIAAMPEVAGKMTGLC
jgi:hypothetical protein